MGNGRYGKLGKEKGRKGRKLEGREGKGKINSDTGPLIDSCQFSLKSH